MESNNKAFEILSKIELSETQKKLLNMYPPLPITKFFRGDKYNEIIKSHINGTDMEYGIDEHGKYIIIKIIVIKKKYLQHPIRVKVSPIDAKLLQHYWLYFGSRFTWEDQKLPFVKVKRTYAKDYTKGNPYYCVTISRFLESCNFDIV